MACPAEVSASSSSSSTLTIHDLNRQGADANSGTQLGRTGRLRTGEVELWDRQTDEQEIMSVKKYTPQEDVEESLRSVQHLVVGTPEKLVQSQTAEAWARYKALLCRREVDDTDIEEMQEVLLWYSDGSACYLNQNRNSNAQEIKEKVIEWGDASEEEKKSWREELDIGLMGIWGSMWAEDGTSMGGFLSHDQATEINQKRAINNYGEVPQGISQSNVSQMGVHVNQVEKSLRQDNHCQAAVVQPEQ